jgi:TetR/AcrR family acrAB operon transcriptional repressor
VSKGAIYLHFGGKDELFEALLWREMWRYGDAWLARTEADPQGGTLGGVYKNALHTVNASPLMAVIFRQDMRILGSYLRKPGNLFATRQANLMRVEFIQMLQEAGTVRKDVDPAVLAHIIEMLGYGFVSIGDFKDPAQMPSFEAVFETIADMMDRAFTEENSDSEAGKAAIRRNVAAARAQLAPGNEQQTGA